MASDQILDNVRTANESGMSSRRYLGLERQIEESPGLEAKTLFR